VVVWIVGAVGVAVLAKWLMREGRRVNAELDAARARAAAKAQPTAKAKATGSTNLERDPQTGVYRPK